MTTRDVVRNWWLNRLVTHSSECRENRHGDCHPFYGPEARSCICECHRPADFEPTGDE